MTTDAMDANLQKVEVGWLMSCVYQHMEDNEANMVDVIASSRGWKPLVVNEKMVVHFGNKEYEIRRKR